VHLLWYFPFAREEELAWAETPPRPGESIVMQVVDQEVAPPGGTQGQVTVVRDLPDVNRTVGRSAWLASRAATYLQRAAARRAMLRANDFDLVHLHYINRFTDSFLRPGAPLVLSVHDVLPHRARLGRAEHVILKRTYDRADAYVVAHESLREALVSDFGLRASSIHVVPLPVLPVPDAVAGPPPDGAPLVLFFGALRPNKGLSVLVEAARLLEGQDVRFVIAGRGDPGEEAIARAAAANDPRIEAHIGFVTMADKQHLYAEASIVVLPYTSFASQSGVLHDAYAHGRPVVVTEVGALGRSVREDGTGLIVPSRDAGSLASAISDLLQPDMWTERARRAEAVRARRSPQESGRLMREVYDTLL
jgi:glycosyltransferase involved in cell wall biosynthesis